MTIPYGRWLATTDEENWDCNESWATQDEATAGAVDALDLLPGDSFTVGLCAEPSVYIAAVNVANIIKDMLQQSEDAGGDDWAEDWLSTTTKEESADLGTRVNTAIAAWFLAHPHHKPGWFVVRKTSDHVTPKEQP